MAARTRSVFLEVERKFSPGPHFIQRLEANKEFPRIYRLERLEDSAIEDIYYDFEGSLSSKGVWIRARNGQWQAKMRLGGDFIDSRHEEIEDYRDIMSLVKKHVPQANPESSQFGLPVFAHFKTFRQTWLANGRFKIVYDRTDFGHEVGEVELGLSYLREKIHQRQRSSIIQRMDQDIEIFIDKHQWAFKASSQRPLGKISAYIAQREASELCPEKL